MSFDTGSPNRSAISETRSEYSQPLMTIIVVTITNGKTNIQSGRCRDCLQQQEYSQLIFLDILFIFQHSLDIGDLNPEPGSVFTNARPNSDRAFLVLVPVSTQCDVTGYLSCSTAPMLMRIWSGNRRWTRQVAARRRLYLGCLPQYAVDLRTLCNANMEGDIEGFVWI